MDVLESGEAVPGAGVGRAVEGKFTVLVCSTEASALGGGFAARRATLEHP